MLETRETVIAPTTQPASEILFGRVVQKARPTSKHAVSQRRVAAFLFAWCDEAGFVGTEQEFRIGPPGEPARSLVPDVCYFPIGEGGLTAILTAEYPTEAPMLAVEVLSPDDRITRVMHKVDVLRRSGTTIVMLVHPDDRTLAIFDADTSRTLEGDATFTHPLLPGLMIPLEALFRDFP
jgi:Uma2 family endonuclease